jgi:hypothetical protein
MSVNFCTVLTIFSGSNKFAISSNETCTRQKYPQYKVQPQQ